MRHDAAIDELAALLGRPPVDIFVSEAPGLPPRPSAVTIATSVERCRQRRAWRLERDGKAERYELALIRARTLAVPWIVREEEARRERLAERRVRREVIAAIKADPDFERLVAEQWWPQRWDLVDIA